MLNPSQTDLDKRQALSALMDGALSDDEVRRLAQAWQHDEDARASWHVYHLVGDVMRSDELAVEPVHDQAFLKRLRARLSAEPVPLATVPMAAKATERPPGLMPSQGASDGLARALPNPGRRHRLMAPAAVAAGLVAVVGALVVFRTAAPPEASGSTIAGAAPSVLQASGMAVLRDARLDRYLQAHRKQSHSLLQTQGGSGQAVQIVYEKP
jgi:sigma-E factor negative regulatory protein RseA